MRVSAALLALVIIGSSPIPAPLTADEVCEGFGPQTPRDISNAAGANPVTFRLAPPFGEMSLCNIHFHKHAEHKGPGFSEPAGSGTFGGFRCNGSGPGASERPPDQVCRNVAAGDTIEVHWVYTTCDVAPGVDLDACTSDGCANPQLRVEAQVFLMVDEPGAASFASFAYRGNVVDGRHQARAVPNGTGEPVVFLGSTTGPRLSDTTCSPLQVTWSVRPQCADLDLRSLGAWCQDNVFEERAAHGVRPLVTRPELLSEIAPRHRH